MDHFHLPHVPEDEEMTNVGDTYDYLQRQRRETAAHIAAIYRVLGPPPRGCRLNAIEIPQKYGNRFAIEITWHGAEAQRYAELCSTEGPKTWKDAGMHVYWNRNWQKGEYLEIFKISPWSPPKAHLMQAALCTA